MAGPNLVGHGIAFDGGGACAQLGEGLLRLLEARGARSELVWVVKNTWRQGGFAGRELSGGAQSTRRATVRTVQGADDALVSLEGARRVARLGLQRGQPHIARGELGRMECRRSARLLKLRRDLVRAVACERRMRAT